MKIYVLEIDETYRLGGERMFIKFDYTPEGEAKAIEAYHNHYRGMVNLCVVEVDENGERISQRLLQDKDGRKYIKGSPFYNFPHVGHRSRIDGNEIG